MSERRQRERDARGSDKSTVAPHLRAIALSSQGGNVAAGVTNFRRSMSRERERRPLRFLCVCVCVCVCALRVFFFGRAWNLLEAGLLFVQDGLGLVAWFLCLSQGGPKFK